MVQGKSSLMSKQLKEFLQKKVNSFVKWDLLRFFHDNPHTKETAENIARYIGRDAQSIERELRELAMAQVLDEKVMSGYRLYQLSDDQEIRDNINQFMEACHDRDFRVEAIHYVIERMQYSADHSA